MRARPHAGPVPQPALDRMGPFAGHAVVVGVVPGGDPLVVRTAAAWAAAAGSRRVAACAAAARAGRGPCGWRGEGQGMTKARPSAVNLVETQM